MNNDFDDIYKEDNPSFFTRYGLEIVRNMDSQMDYIISGNLASLIWDISWNIHEYIGNAYSSREIKKQPKDVLLNKIILLNGALSEAYNKQLIEIPEVFKQVYYVLSELKKWNMLNYNDNLTEDEINLLTESLNKKLKQKYCNSESQA